MLAKRPTIYVNAKPMELQSFEFFMRQIVPGFTRIVDKQFWHRLVPQLSHSDRVIWDALIAMARLIQHPQHSQTFVLPRSTRIKKPVTNEEHRRALRWYSRSIAGLQTRMKQGSTWWATNNVTCILYICIECLQDNTVEAFNIHERAATMLVMGTRRSPDACAKSQSELCVEDTSRALLRHFSISHGQPIHQSRLTSYHLERTYEVLTNAKEGLYLLLIEAHGFVMRAHATKEAQAKYWTPTANENELQTHILAKFMQWYSAISEHICNHKLIPGSDEDELYAVLLVAYSHWYVMLSSCLSKSATVFDNFLHIFQSMVEHASRAIAVTKGHTRPVFIFETRFIPSLYFVAINCRHPIIRRQAIALLRVGPKIENLWRAEQLVEIAEMCVGIEESGSEQGLFHADAHNIELPPEHHRIWSEHVVELPDSQARPCYYLKFGRWHQDENLEWVKTEHCVKMRNQINNANQIRDLA